jgi:opacity protein-like surface antigen
MGRPSDIIVAALAALLVTSTAVAETGGRTDGPEASEHGQGGYPFGGSTGRFYVSPAFGSGFLDLVETGSRSGRFYGLDVGYERDGWVGMQAAYAYLPDQDLSIYSIGTRLAYPTDPFVYYLSTHAGLYARETGTNHFGLAPGAGIDVAVSGRIRIGLDYKHDFVFRDTFTQDVDRVCAGVMLYF